jgi:hypothetical protein
VQPEGLQIKNIAKKAAKSNLPTRAVRIGLLRKGQAYDRKTLAAMWGYASYHALARGVVTPAGHDLILLFVTEMKQRSATRYRDRLVGVTLQWEGPRDHFAEDRILKAAQSGERIFVLYRRRHHQPFVFLGLATLASATIRDRSPSRFEMLVEVPG